MKNTDVAGGELSVKIYLSTWDPIRRTLFPSSSLGPKVPLSRAQSLQPQPTPVDAEITVSKLPRIPSAEQLAVEKPLDKPQEKPKDKLPERPGDKKRSEKKVEVPAEPVEVGTDLLALAEGSDLLDFLQGGFR